MEKKDYKEVPAEALTKRELITFVNQLEEQLDWAYLRIDELNDKIRDMECIIYARND